MNNLYTSCTGTIEKGAVLVGIVEKAKYVAETAEFVAV